MKIKNLFLAMACLFGLATVISSCSKNDDDTPVVHETYFTSSMVIATVGDGTREQVVNSLKDYFTKELGADAKVSLEKEDQDYKLSIVSVNGEDKVIDKLADIQDRPSDLNSIIDGINGITAVQLEIKHNGITDLTYEYKSCYSVVGIWRHADNDGKFGTLYVQVEGDNNISKAAFTYNGKGYEGKLFFLNSKFIFRSDDKSLKIEGYFTDKNNDKITCNVEYNEEEVANGLTFERRQNFNTVTYEEFFTVEDPDNELPALGIDLNDLKNQAAKVTFKKEVTNGRIDTNIGMMFTVVLHTDVRADSIAKEQTKQYPALANTKAFVKGEIKTTYDDMKFDLFDVKNYYNNALAGKKD